MNDFVVESIWLLLIGMALILGRKGFSSGIMSAREELFKTKYSDSDKKSAEYVPLIMGCFFILFFLFRWLKIRF